MVLFLGYAHAQVDWDRLRYAWNNKLLESVLMRLVQYIKGPACKGLARRRNNMSLTTLGLPTTIMYIKVPHWAYARTV